ncbi:MAG: biopolymer transporter ExbD [Lentisphaeria bacterium]|nr:biopolymer transporter ExbD [Lentisphaeria bacterium]
MSKKKLRGDTAAEIPMSAMIDVVFLLLIYFIVTQKDEISEAHLAVNLPSPNPSQQEEIDPPKLLELHVLAGRVLLNGNEYKLDVIQEKLERLASLDPDMTVLIKTSGKARTKEQVAVLDLCKGAGLSKLNVMTLLD